MADQKITALTENTTPITSDILPMVDDPAGTPITKKVTIANLVTDAIMTTSDVTTNNVSTSKHGFVPKAPNSTTQFLRGDATWATPSGPFTTVRKTGLEQGALTTSLTQAVNETAFTLAASTNYVFEYWVRYRTAAATTGLVLAVETPGSPVGVWGWYGTPLAATGTVTGGAVRGSNSTFSISSGGVDTSDSIAYFTGIVMNGTNAGTMQLKFCTEVSGSASSIRTGTMGRIMQIT